MSDDLVAKLLNLGPDDSGFREVGVAAAQALTEARAEIERLRSSTVGDWASQRENDALTIEKYEWKARALAAESELSTLRARVREVVGPISGGLMSIADLRAFRQLNEDLK